MQSVITTAFETYLQDCIVQQQQVVLDEIVLAYIPNLDPGATIPPSQGMPTAEQIVHRRDVDQAATLDDNAVAYSIMLDTGIGDFDFNAMVLCNKALDMAAMIVHKETESKIQTAAGQQGNSLVKTLVMEYDGATESTGITVTPATWQLDLSEQFAAKSDVGHGHAIGDVSGLSSALAGKSNTGHSHAIGDVSGLQTALNGKSATGHGHAIGDVSGLQSAIDGKSATGHGHAIGDVAGLQTALNGKSSTGHGHTPASVGAAPASHGHAIAGISGLQEALDAAGVQHNLTTLLYQDTSSPGTLSADWDNYEDLYIVIFDGGADLIFSIPTALITGNDSAWTGKVVANGGASADTFYYRFGSTNKREFAFALNEGFSNVSVYGRYPKA